MMGDRGAFQSKPYGCQEWRTIKHIKEESPARANRLPNRSTLD
jgi:hypothetical protein